MHKDQICDFQSLALWHMMSPLSLIIWFSVKYLIFMVAFGVGRESQRRSCYIGADAKAELKR